MEIKRNEATVNRPEGDRVIDGTYVFIDIPSFMEQLKEEKAWEKNDRNGITVFKSDTITMVISAFKKDAEIRDNTVDGFLTLQILEGQARISTPDGEIDAEKNRIVAFHPQVAHSMKALTDMIVMLTTYSNNKEEG